jgi:hypothetical protein
VDDRLLDKYLSQATKYRTWKLGNDCLYSLCANNPHHGRIEDVVAKLWLIGRSYSAALERRKNKHKNDPEFYEYIAAPAIIKSELDFQLKRVREYPGITNKNLHILIEIHSFLTNLFCQITELNKVSLASKYLHFHFPAHFFLMDSRARIGLRKLAKGARTSLSFPDDYGYGKFCAKLIALRQHINTTKGQWLSPRKIDTLLLMIADTE